jgi:hypothetical protein
MDVELYSVGNAKEYKILSNKKLLYSILMDRDLPNLLCMSILCTMDVGTRNENAHLSNYRISYLPYTMQSFNARIRPTFL